MPHPVSTDLLAVVNQLPSHNPNVGIRDSVEWILTPLKVYTCKSAWNAIRCVGPTVIWHKLVWGKDCVPWLSFIFWLVCWNQLRTKDLSYRWGKVADNWCVLCGKLAMRWKLESISSTRFQMLQQCNQSFRGCRWDRALDFAISSWRSKEKVREEHGKHVFR